MEKLIKAEQWKQVLEELEKARIKPKQIIGPEEFASMQVTARAKLKADKKAKAKAAKDTKRQADVDAARQRAMTPPAPAPVPDALKPINVVRPGTTSIPSSGSGVGTGTRQEGKPQLEPTVRTRVKNSLKMSEPEDIAVDKLIKSWNVMLEELAKVKLEQAGVKSDITYDTPKLDAKLQTTVDESAQRKARLKSMSGEHLTDTLKQLHDSGNHEDFHYVIGNNLNVTPEHRAEYGIKASSIQPSAKTPVDTAMTGGDASRQPISLAPATNDPMRPLEVSQQAREAAENERAFSGIKGRTPTAVPIVTAGTPAAAAPQPKQPTVNLSGTKILAREGGKKKSPKGESPGKPQSKFSPSFLKQVRSGKIQLSDKDREFMESQGFDVPVPRAVKKSEETTSDLQQSEILEKPPVSEAQRKAMWAAASGKSKIGIPASVGKEFAEKDPGGELPERVAKGGGMAALAGGFKGAFGGTADAAPPPPPPPPPPAPTGGTNGSAMSALAGGFQSVFGKEELKLSANGQWNIEKVELPAVPKTEDKK